MSRVTVLHVRLCRCTGRTAHRSESIVCQSEPRESSWDTSVLAVSPPVSDPLAAVEKAYYGAQVDELLFDRALNEAAGVRAVYTAIHGVGTAYAQRIGSMLFVET